MKVKVSYTMNYEDVPALASELAEDCMRRLRGHGKLQLNYHNLNKLAEEIKRVQEDLSLAHDQLGDCLSLLAGYEGAKEQPMTPPPLETDFVYPPSEDLLDESD